MDRLKDFFYNKNDIVVALIISVVAGFIIYTQVMSLLDYPRQLATSNHKKIQELQKEESERAIIEKELKNKSKIEVQKDNNLDLHGSGSEDDHRDHKDEH